ncbi:MAG: alginate lyase-domain-containing protein [Podila humilis]|nr:MAG: alginate lyase-domain-containing protein [Podila humilis]
MVYIRGSSKRTITVVLGLCVVFVLFTLTPYSDKALSNLPDHGFRHSTEDQALEQERRRKQKEQWENEHNMPENPYQNEQVEKPEELNKQLFENPPGHDNGNTNAPSNDEPRQQKQGEPSPGQDEDSPNDGLPTEFLEFRVPSSSQQIMETKIGASRLKEFLAEKQNIEAREVAVAYILRQANVAYRNNTVYSVVNKPETKIPPSGDIHDYTSLARYFWKNPKTPDNLPYIRLDGKPNPDMDSVWDYRLLRKMFRDCYYMGQGYFWTGDERYAEKIVYRVKEWFLDEKTKMNSHLKYGSLIFGNPLGRAQGVLDMFKVYGMFDGLKAIQGSKAMQREPELIKNLQSWFTDYLVWMDASIQANQEKNAHNNHGTYFTVQYLSILEFLGRDADAKIMAEDAKAVRVGPQIREDGAQPHETIRPISFFYSTFNLQGLILLAIQADSHGVSLWNHRGPIEDKTIRINSSKSVPIKVGGGSIEDAVRYLSLYAVRDPSEWPYPDSGTRNERDVLKMARIAALVYGKDKWEELIENLEAKVDENQPGEGEGGEGATTTTADDGDPNGFICELGVLSKGTLWHCYK